MKEFKVIVSNSRSSQPKERSGTMDEEIKAKDPTINFSNILLHKDSSKLGYYEKDINLITPAEYLIYDKL